MASMRAHVIAGLVLSVVVTAPASAASPGRSTVVPLRAYVVGFAQDGGRVAWAGGDCWDVRIRVLATGLQRYVGGGQAKACQQVGEPVSALAGTRALWIAGEGGN